MTETSRPTTDRPGGGSMRPPRRPAPSRAAARRQAATRQRNRRLALVVVGVIVLAAVVLIVVQSQRSSSGTANAVAPSSATGPGGSFVEGQASAPVLVEEYSDFQCPVCGVFQKQTYPTITQLVSTGKIRFATHLFPFIGGESYAAANAVVAAGQEGKFWPMYDYLFANQHPENSGYWTSDTLIGALKQVGADTPAAEQVVRKGTYVPWLRKMADQASQRGVTGTPTIFVNGSQLSDRSPAGLTSAVNAAAQHA